MTSCLISHLPNLQLQPTKLKVKQPLFLLGHYASKPYTKTSMGSIKVMKKEQETISEKLFEGKEIVLVFSSRVPNKERIALKNKIIENGAKARFIVTKRSYLLASDSDDLASHKFSFALQYGVPIVTLDYLHDSLRECRLLPFDNYLVAKSIYSDAFRSGKVKILEGKSFGIKKLHKSGPVVVAPYTGSDCLDGFELVKAVQLNSLKSLTPYQKGKMDETTVHYYVIELHIRTVDCMHRYCVFTHEGILCNGELQEQNPEMTASKLCRYFDTSDEATAMYARIYNKMTSLPHLMKQCDTLLHPDVGSPSFQNLQMERHEMLWSLDPKVSELVGLLWYEAIGHISKFLSAKSIQPWMVYEAKGILLQILSVLGRCSIEMLGKLGQEFYSILPHHSEHRLPLVTKKTVVQKLDLCQVLTDMIAISEATGWALDCDLNAKYRALRCRLRYVPDVSSPEIQNVLSSMKECSVKNVFEVNRSIERAMFSQKISNRKLLFHCTPACNVAGILSHGLLPPLLAVTKRGVERTDVGMLGSGIYFTDSITHALKYSTPGSEGTRFLLVAMVALGEVYEVYNMDPSLDCPPEGYNSVKGVKTSGAQPSDFSHDEYVIYNPNQQYLCYLVEFTIPQDTEVIEHISKDKILTNFGNPFPEGNYSYELNETEKQKEKAQFSGLKIVSDNATPDMSVSLEAVHVRAQIIDTVAKVTLFQVYRNQYNADLQVKFVFPLEFGAAICGFEAFIGSKHIQGQVKEKQTAHKEYKKAISEGHGAYLLDEDQPDVFTVHVGNLPAQTTAVIKISYISELPVEKDSVKFSLPVSVAPWQKNSGINMLQSDASMAENVEAFSFVASFEMASEIVSLSSPSHKIKVKKTETKAVVKLDDSNKWGETLTLYASLTNAHVPRMWVEQHPEKDSEACMLTFYPEFEVQQPRETEIILMIDASNSMRGDSFQDAIRISLLFLKNLKMASSDCFRFNIVAFGTFFKELFPVSKTFTIETLKHAESFLKEISPNMGSTDLRRVLRMYDLLASNQLSMFVVSDGHVSNDDIHIMGFVSSIHSNTRVFTFATSDTANKHLLRTLSSLTGGAFESFGSSEISDWEEKVSRQMSRARQPALTRINVHWEQHSEENEILQAPQKISSLFVGECLVVYGLISNCTMATLKAAFQDKEFSTVVSTSELGKTTGILIHSLAARGIVRDWENGPLDENSSAHWLKKRSSKDTVIELAKEHSLVTSLTSFIAVETRSEHEIIDDKPPIDKLIAAVNVDILPYMDFYEDQQESFHTEPMKKIKKKTLKRVDFVTEGGPLAMPALAPPDAFMSREGEPIYIPALAPPDAIMSREGEPVAMPALAPPDVIMPPEFIAMLEHDLLEAEKAEISVDSSLEYEEDEMGFCMFEPTPPQPSVARTFESFESRAKAFSHGYSSKQSLPGSQQQQQQAKFVPDPQVSIQPQPLGFSFETMRSKANVTTRAAFQPQTSDTGFSFSTSQSQSDLPAFVFSQPQIQQPFSFGTMQPKASTPVFAFSQPQESQSQQHSRVNFARRRLPESQPRSMLDSKSQITHLQQFIGGGPVTSHFGGIPIPAPPEIIHGPSSHKLSVDSDTSEDSVVKKRSSKPCKKKREIVLHCAFRRRPSVERQREVKKKDADDSQILLGDQSVPFLQEIWDEISPPQSRSRSASDLEMEEEIFPSLFTSIPEKIDQLTFTFVETVLSWKGGGLPICSAIFAKTKLIANQKRLLDALPSDSVQAPRCLTEKEMQLIIAKLEKHGLESLGKSISERIVEFIRHLFTLFAHLLERVIPQALIFKGDDFDKVVEHAGAVFLVSDKDWMTALSGVNAVDKMYPLLYDNLQLGKSWEHFVMNFIFNRSC